MKNARKSAGNLNLILLPATEPGDTKYGTTPDRVESHPDASIVQIHYPTMVWYNAAIRTEAIRQIRSLNAAPFVLVGFSKSGLGAWNIARTIPDLIAATIIFDAPAARMELPPWGTAPFYANDAAWQEDQPMNTIGRFKASMPETHRLVLISGASFHQEMCTLSQALSGANVNHSFLPRPSMKHHWQAGWIDEGLKALLAHGPLG